MITKLDPYNTKNDTSCYQCVFSCASMNILKNYVFYFGYSGYGIILLCTSTIQMIFYVIFWTISGKMRFYIHIIFSIFIYIYIYISMFRYMKCYIECRLKASIKKKKDV